jgi:hypothetical protein
MRVYDIKVRGSPNILADPLSTLVCMKYFHGKMPYDDDAGGPSWQRAQQALSFRRALTGFDSL